MRYQTLVPPLAVMNMQIAFCVNIDAEVATVHRYYIDGYLVTELNVMLNPPKRIPLP